MIPLDYKEKNWVELMPQYIDLERLNTSASEKLLLLLLYIYISSKRIILVTFIWNL